MIPAGSTLRFSVSGVAGGWVPMTADQLRTQLVTAISEYLTVDVLDVRSTADFYELLEWGYVATATVRTREAYASADGPASLISHAAYVVTGNMATTTASGTVPDAQSSTETDGVSWIDRITRAIGQGVGNVAAPLTTEINRTLVLVAIVVVAGAYLLAGKNTRVGVL